MSLKNKLKSLLLHDELNQDKLFEGIIDYNNIKRLFRMALDSTEPVHILLSGPPASAKTMFLQSLMKLHNSYFIDGSNTTKSGVTDYIFDNKPKYLLIDEIDKMPTKDQSFLLNLMETGIVSETKNGKTRSADMKTWIFATSNTISKVMLPLQSRFLTVKLGLYTYEQFYNITIRLLTQRHRVKEDISKAAAFSVWNSSRNIRDCVKIGIMAKSIEDVDFINDSFLKHS